MMSILRCLGFSAVVATHVNVAFGDEASDYLAAAGDEVRAYTKCTDDYAGPRIAGTMAPEKIADNADRECADKVAAITTALQGEPTKLSLDAAQKVTQDVVTRLHDDLVTLIKQRRN